jgi:hypothetical protein
MNGRVIERKLGQITDRVWETALKVERISDIASDLSERIYDVKQRPDLSMPDAHRIQKEAATKLKELFWSLVKIDNDLQEVAWSVDEIVDLIQELSSK